MTEPFVALKVRRPPALALHSPSSRAPEALTCTLQEPTAVPPTLAMDAPSIPSRGRRQTVLPSTVVQLPLVARDSQLSDAKWHVPNTVKCSSPRPMATWDMQCRPFNAGARPPALIVCSVQLPESTHSRHVFTAPLCCASFFARAAARQSTRPPPYSPSPRLVSSRHDF